MALGRSGPRPAVSLEEGAPPGSPRCPACDEPLFVWIETEGWGPREDQIVDRCESCGLAVPRDAVPAPGEAAAQLFGAGETTAAAGGRGRNGADGHGPGAGRGRNGEGEIVVRAANASSLQAWLGAENWAAMRPGDRTLKPTPRAAELLASRRGLRLLGVRHLAGPGMASMWQTLLNLLTFHRDFAGEAISKRLRPSGGRGRAAYAIDAMVTVLAAVPTAILAVILEGGAVLARRGGVIELRAGPR